MMTYCQLDFCADKIMIYFIITTVKTNSLYHSFNLHLKLFITSLYNITMKVKIIIGKGYALIKQPIIIIIIIQKTFICYNLQP